MTSIFYEGWIAQKEERSIDRRREAMSTWMCGCALSYRRPPLGLTV